MIPPSSPPFAPDSPPPVKHRSTIALSCPLQRQTELRLVHAESLLVECNLADPPICPAAFPFGGANFCRMLWKFKGPDARHD